MYADKAYASSILKDQLKLDKINLECPNKRNFKKKVFNESNIGKKRYVIEGCFSWIKAYRRIRNRYDSLAIYFEAFIELTFALVIATKIFNLKTSL